MVAPVTSGTTSSPVGALIDNSSSIPDYKSLVQQNIWGDLIPGSQPQQQQKSSHAPVVQQLTNFQIPPLVPPMIAPQRPQAGPGGFMGPLSSNAVVKSAQSYIGDPYQWGGTSRSGLDCSGLVQDVFASQGIQLPRTTYEQARMGQPVANIQQAQPGDAVFFNGNEHVGIYIGNGQMIDAPHTGTTVGVHNISGYGPISAIRRY